VGGADEVEGPDEVDGADEADGTDAVWLRTTAGNAVATQAAQTAISIEREFTVEPRYSPRRRVSRRHE
jgi:hypothetical protein